MTNTRILCVLDGFGLTSKSANNAAYLAKMPNFRNALKNNYWTTLDADGEFVGQESGLVGNSEVGHMNIGGLQMVKQLSYQVTESSGLNFDCDNEKTPQQLFDPKKLLQKNWEYISKTKIVHVAGLFSTGTIHSDLRHWAGAVCAAGDAGAEKIVLHLLTDGRDSDRQSLVATWDNFVNNNIDKLNKYSDKIFLGSVGGRFFAMDRDKNWDRVAQGLLPMINLSKLGEINQLNYDDHFQVDDNFINFFRDKYSLEYTKIFEKMEFYRDNEHEKSVVLGDLRQNWQLSTATWRPVSELGQPSKIDRFEEIKLCLQNYAQQSYQTGVFDETLVPKSVDDNSISTGDSLILVNFRSDRMKQVTALLTDINSHFGLNLTIMSMNDYDIGRTSILDYSLNGFEANTDNYYPIFKNKPVENTLSETISKMNKTQLHIAETEKYNHVTYFMNGGQSKKSAGEDWVVIDSNKVASHAEKPKMKAGEITDYIIDSGLGKYDYILVNYANPDMVGHTGDIPASIESMEFLDEQLGRLFEACEQGGHKILITADHGNIEVVGEYESNGATLTDTEHNPNPVPCVIIDSGFQAQPLVDRVLETAKKYDLGVDIDLLQSVLNQKNQIDINDQQSWIEKDQIPVPKLPLWYAGLLTLDL